MNISTLRTELLAATYDGMSAQQKADELNAVDKAADVATVDPWTIDNLVPTAELVALENATGGVESAFLNKWRDVRTANRATDTNSAVFQGALTYLQSQGVFSTSTVDAITALGTTTTSRAAQLGLGRVFPHHVRKAGG